MNIITLIGRAVKDAEIRYSAGEKSVAYGSYTLAVERPWRKDKEKETDFIVCKVVGKTAEFAEKYITKGTKMAVVGSMQIDNYTDKDGNKKQSVYVQVSSQEFCESKSSNNNGSNQTVQNGGSDFMTIPAGIVEELPFN